MIADKHVIKGAGLGLRSSHFKTILDDRPDVPWYEILADNYMIRGGQFIDALEKLGNGYFLNRINLRIICYQCRKKVLTGKHSF